MTATRPVGRRLTLAALLTLAPVLALAEGDAPPSPPPPAEATALTSTDVNAWLDGYLPYALKTGDIAGAVVAVVKDGAVLTERGYGYSDVAARKRVDPKLTLFRPGSVSKLFTWTAVMQLVEQGKIDLDADVNTYLDFKIPPRDGKPITMRNLMQHTAGFEEQAKGTITEGSSPGFEALLKAWVRHACSRRVARRLIPTTAHRSPATSYSACRASPSMTTWTGTSSRRSR
jgi:CubicO group peptidase (beta-lactamase class C family)